MQRRLTPAAVAYQVELALFGGRDELTSRSRQSCGFTRLELGWYVQSVGEGLLR